MPVPPKDVREAVETIRQLAPRLNQITDTAASVILEVEAILNDECNVGIPTWVKYAGQDEAKAAEYLGYVRVGSRFRIAIVETVHGINRGEPKPWADCPREYKLDSFAALPALLTAISERLARQVAQADQITKSVVGMLSGIRKAAGQAHQKPAQPAESDSGGAATQGKPAQSSESDSGGAGPKRKATQTAKS